MTADGFAGALGSGEEEYADDPQATGLQVDLGPGGAAQVHRPPPLTPTDDREAQDVEALTLVLARSDGQDWGSLDDAPTRAEFMGYPDMAAAILASDWLAARERAAAEKAWNQGASEGLRTPKGLGYTLVNPYTAARIARSQP